MVKRHTYHRKPTNKRAYSDFSEVDVVILAGGLGTRLRSMISDRPKVLAQIGNKPFLEILLQKLFSHGARRVILCAGYLKEGLADYIKSRRKEDERFLGVEFSNEDVLLGTGGALKNVEGLISSDHFLAMNGDSFCDLDYKTFYSNHLERGGVLSMAVTESKNNGKSFGSAVIDSNQKIVEFQEKTENAKGGLVNAGIYFMKKGVFKLMPAHRSFSLEYDFFPKILEHGCYGFVHDGNFIDIGTPEGYNLANKRLVQ